jgi:hypothetical protein
VQLTTRTKRRPAAPATSDVQRRAAPTGRIEFGRTGEARHRNPGWLLGGVLLVLVSAIGGVLLFSSADDRRGVLVAAGDIEVGQPVERSHLRVVQMSAASGVQTLGTGDASALIGQIPVGRVPAGTVLNPSMFSSSSPLAADEMVFGAALDPGEAPMSSVTVGAAVRLVAAPRAVAGAEREPGAPPPADVIGDGVIWDYETLGSGKLWLSVRTTVDVGLRASKAAQDDELRVVIIGGDPEPAADAATDPATDATTTPSDAPTTEAPTTTGGGG